MKDIYIQLRIKQSDTTIIQKINELLEKEGIYKEQLSNKYITHDTANSYSEKDILATTIKEKVLSIIQSVANEKNTQITIEQLFICVDFGLKQVPFNYSDTLQSDDMAATSGDYKPIIIKPR